MVTRATRIALILRSSTRVLLWVFATFWLVFALLSGAQEAGGGLKGILLNSPNAIPWLVLFVLIGISYKWEVVGGTLIVIKGITTLFAYDTYQSPVAFFMISFPLILGGGSLLICRYLMHRGG